ncbi:MAG TPA: biotin transporter BioY [Candidatus Polarisedimenticolia bacterium]|nr:biotin transporter BioY [Candidatus Polarisedimenticolia bacterium]
MHNPTSPTLAPPSARGVELVRRLAAPVLFAALVALGGQVRVPIPGNPVPLTLQVVFVLLAGAWLAPRAAALSMALFLTVGAAGAPVFADGRFGAAHLLGPTGGYLTGFIAGAAVCSLLLRGRRDSLVRTAASMAAGVAAIHLIGALHLGIYLGSFQAAALFADDFLLMDIVKVAAAATIVSGSSGVFSAGANRGNRPGAAGAP